MTDSGTVLCVDFRGDRFYASRTRKHADCWRCDSLICAGEPAFRPLGRSANRDRRICGTCVEALVDGGVAHLAQSEKGTKQ